MRRKIVAGNWKMNKTYDEGIALVKECLELLKNVPANVQVVFAPTSIHLKSISDLIASNPNIHCAAQNCHWEKNGAFTGEVSVNIIKSTGATFVLVGHSERREYNHETNMELALKINACIASGLTPVFCCGESLEVRESSKHYEWIKTQLNESLFQLTHDEIVKTVIAYEPIWAIGTGKTATAEQAQEVHSFIRKLIAEKYSDDIANQISILYGGSCKPSNAKELFSQPDIDGGLIGGASLVASDFIGIVHSF